MNFRKQDRSVVGFFRNKAGFTSLQAATVFAVAGALTAFFALPFLELSAPRLGVAAGSGWIDSITTGSVKSAPVKRYTVRRSVLQDPAAEPCLIFSDGREEGDC